MPVRPNFLERLVLFRLNRGPAPMLDLFGAAGFEAVGLAIELGMFDALADGGRVVVLDQFEGSASRPDLYAFADRR